MDGYIADGTSKEGYHCAEDADWYSKAGVGNNTWCYVTASGRSLGHLGEVGPWQALEAYRKLGEADRRPPVKPAPEAEKGIPFLRPPPGGLVVRAYGTALERRAGGGLTRASKVYTDLFATSAGCVEPALTQVDMLWMTRSEARSLLPKEPVVGARQRMPEILERRMIAQTIPKCGPIGDSGELSIEVTEVQDSRVTLRLEGFSRKGRRFEDVEAAFAKKKEDPSVGREHEGQVLRYFGYLSYDLKKEVFSAFNIVAVGEAWGENTNRAHGSGAGSEPKRWPVGFAFELGTRSAADRITPPAIVQNALYNGGFSEAYWGK